MEIDYSEFIRLSPKEKTAIINKLESLRSVRPGPEKYITIMERISGESLETRARDREIADARNVLFYYLVKKLGYSSTLVGKFLGRDHSTVSHGCRVVKNALEVKVGYESILRIYEEFINQIKSSCEG